MKFKSASLQSNQDKFLILFLDNSRVKNNVKRLEKYVYEIRGQVTKRIFQFHRKSFEITVFKYTDKGIEKIRNFRYHYQDKLEKVFSSLDFQTFS